MKKINGILVALMLLAMIGCSTDNNDDSAANTEEKTTTGATLSEEEVSKLVRTRMTEAVVMENVELPAWLQDVLKEREAKDVNIGVAGTFAIPVYQFTWNGDTFYFVYDPLDSCITCNSVYHKDGTRHHWAGTAETEDFVKNSKDWTCVYKPSTSK